ncbi:MAG: PIN domain-containing protein [Candidatus Sericytochromatia bacterium]|nr:PIN domain-containing protein [Candidatus Sericytochromatia bacterium]
MGLIIDTGVLITLERLQNPTLLAAWESQGPGFLSAITCSELLVGVHKADSPQRRSQRSAFVENILETFPILEFDLASARAHAQILAQLPRGVMVDAHDLLIGATALRHGMPVLTGNGKDFARIPGLTVLDFNVGAVSGPERA